MKLRIPVKHYSLWVFDSDSCHDHCLDVWLPVRPIEETMREQLARNGLEILEMADFPEEIKEIEVDLTQVEGV